mgnify:CR=1 FL=1
MVFIINPPVGAFNQWLYDGLASMGEGSKLLLGAVLGGMMAIDFGGPFNKAAYVFGTAAIASGQFDIMAAVMAGGMVPPIGIATLPRHLLKNRFTESVKTDDCYQLYYGTIIHYRREQFHLRHLIRCALFRHQSSVQQWQERFQWHSDVAQEHRMEVSL